MVSENQTKSKFIEPRLDLTSSLMEKESGEHVGPLSLLLLTRYTLFFGTKFLSLLPKTIQSTTVVPKT